MRSELKWDDDEVELTRVKLISHKFVSQTTKLSEKLHVLENSGDYKHSVI